MTKELKRMLKDQAEPTDTDGTPRQMSRLNSDIAKLDKEQTKIAIAELKRRIGQAVRIPNELVTALVPPVGKRPIAYARPYAQPRNNHEYHQQAVWLMTKDLDLALSM